MRYISVANIERGMVLGQDIWDSNGYLLLRHGQSLYQSYINRLFGMGINGVYIDDELTRDIEIRPVIKDETRMNAVRNIRGLYMASNRSSMPDKAVDEAIKAVEEMVDEIFFATQPIYDVREFKTEKDYNYYHAINVATISMIMGTELKMKKPELRMLGICAAFCDIGLSTLDPSLLEKKTPLTQAELDLIRQHPLLGFSLLREKPGIHSRVGQGVLQHHERFNGTGYPEGLSGDAICLFARVIGIADVYDALISARPQRPAVPPFEAFEYVMANGDILFDPALVQVFTRKVAAYPIGTEVRLSDGCRGVIMSNHYDCPLRPVVKFITDPSAAMRIVDLKNDPGARSLTISEA